MHDRDLIWQPRGNEVQENIVWKSLSSETKITVVRSCNIGNSWLVTSTWQGQKTEWDILTNEKPWTGKMMEVMETNSEQFLRSLSAFLCPSCAGLRMLAAIPWS